MYLSLIYVIPRYLLICYLRTLGCLSCLFIRLFACLSYVCASLSLCLSSSACLSLGTSTRAHCSTSTTCLVSPYLSLIREFGTSVCLLSVTLERLAAKVMAATRSARDRGAERYTAASKGTRPPSSVENCPQKTKDTNENAKARKQRRQQAAATTAADECQQVQRSYVRARGPFLWFSSSESAMSYHITQAEKRRVSRCLIFFRIWLRHAMVVGGVARRKFHSPRYRLGGSPLPSY